MGMNKTLATLKSDYLTRINFAPRAGESAAEAFDSLRKTNPDLFPSPRTGESFWDAVRYATYTDAELASGAF